MSACSSQSSGETYQFIVRGVRSAPFTLGKHRAGTISRSQATASAFSGFEKMPKCHGSGLKRARSKKSLRPTGVWEMSAISAHQLGRSTHNECCVLADSTCYPIRMKTRHHRGATLTKREHSINRDSPSKQQQAQQRRNHQHTPRSLHRRLRPRIDFTPSPTPQNRSITRIRKCHPCCSDRDTLSAEKLGDHSQREERKTCPLPQNLGTE